jgi:hypothetical protein
MKRAPNQPITEALTIFEGIYCKAYTVPDAETLLPQHSHRWGHVTAVTSGAVRVWRDGVQLGDFHAPSLISIPAHMMHAFLTLTPATGLLCIHNADHAEADGEPPIAEHHNLVLED